MTVRRCVKQGQWYPDAAQLPLLLSYYYKHSPRSGLKFIIAPHAGLSYSAQSQGAVFSAIDLSAFSAIIILGVQHGYHKPGLSRSYFQHWQDPLDSSNKFEVIEAQELDTYPKRADEDEHSIELLMPYVSFISKQQNRQLPILPIYVGSILDEGYYRILNEMVGRLHALLIVSSDFCHFGRRFGYAPQMGGMDANYVVDYVNKEVVNGIIESRAEFLRKMEETQNTVCGHYTIAAALAVWDGHYKAEMLSYTKSSQLRDFTDSNVSYVGMVGY